MESESVGTEPQNDLKTSLVGQEEEQPPDTKVETEETPKSPTESNHGSPPCSSPEPSCAICLGPLQNKSFTDSCFHTFCFTCLLSWSKVKAECPLCKQKFKSIVHNVRSIEDYDQYYIVARSSESSWSTDGRRRFRYSSTVTAERVLERRRQVAEDVNQSEYQMHRSMFAPHTVTYHHTTNLTTSETEDSSAIRFRQRVYNEDMWVRPINGNTKVRDTSPNFYFHNPACTHRMVPWLNRELVAILSDQDTRIIFLMDLILSLILRFDIRSQEFFLHLQSYLGDRTRHFVHEFYSFASSPYDMEQYDNVMTYDCVINAEDTIVISSPDPDIVSFSGPFSNSAASASGTNKREHRKSKKHRSAMKLYLKKNQDSDIWNVLPSSSRAENSPDNYVSVLDMSIPGPSNAFTRSTVIHEAPPSTSVDLTTINDESSDDDCVIVDVIKPKSERPHEVIDLISSGAEDEASQSREIDDDVLNANLFTNLDILYQATELIQALSNQPSQTAASELKKSLKSAKSKCKKHTCKKRSNRRPRDYVLSSSDTDEYVPEKYSVPPGQVSHFSSGSAQISQNAERNYWYSDTTDIDKADSSDDKPSSSTRPKIWSVVGNVEHHKSRVDHTPHGIKKHKHKKKCKHLRHKHHKHHRSTSKDS